MKSTWLDNVSSEVYERLANCRSRKSDILPLARAKWAYMKKQGMEAKSFQKEDALIAIMELLDCNGWSNNHDLTKDEYNDILDSML